MRRLFVALTLVAAGISMHAQTRVPTIDQLIELKRPGGVALSPDGTKVAFTVNETNWDDNAYETEIFIVDTKGGSPLQLTRAKKSSSGPAWSADGKWIAFSSDRSDKRQLYLISPAGGEALPAPHWPFTGIAREGPPHARTRNASERGTMLLDG